MSCISPEAYFYLNEKVSDQHDILTLACDFSLWESMAPQLHLEDVDIQDIKNEHSSVEERRFVKLRF